MSRPTFLTIDLGALKHNLARARQIAPQQKLMAMVKANGYGHGILRVANALKEADAFGVASLDEAISLRDAGITNPIVLMEGVFYPDELIEAARLQLTLVVHHEPHIEMLEKISMQDAFSVWLKINTGMHRLGIPPENILAFHKRLSAIPAIKKPIGLMTHFAEADHLDKSVTDEQIQLFKKSIDGLKGPVSLANSAGILAWKNSHGDWIRPGLLLYGASPFANKTGIDHNLQPVMTLHSRLIAITDVKKGGRIGYGGVFTAPRDMRIGVVGVGYGDGYPQFAENGTPVLVNNIECELVGRVSMDMLTVDLSQVENAAIGDPVVLWGKGLPVEKVANHCQTSAYEILTRMTPRPKIDVRDAE